MMSGTGVGHGILGCLFVRRIEDGVLGCVVSVEKEGVVGLRTGNRW
jgi:hypothetical protein